MALQKNKGKKLNFIQKGGEQSIPPKFIAAMGRTEEIQSVPMDIIPNNVSTTIVESKVVTDRTDERVLHTVGKTSGTITLAEQVRTEHGIATRTETLATAGSTTPGTSALTLKEETENLGNGQEATDKIAVASFPSLVGQIYDRDLNAVFKYTEQRQAKATADAAAGNPATEITPEDFSRSVVRVYDLTAIQTALDAVVESNHVFINLDLPPVLTGFTSVFTKDKADGTSTKTAVSGSAGVDDFSHSISANSSAQGGAGIIADLVPDIDQKDGHQRDGIEYFFYMSTTFTLAQLLTRLTTIVGSSVLDKLRFYPRPLTIVAYGAKRSEAVNSEYSAALKVTSTGGSNTTYLSKASGKGDSGDVSLNSRLIQIPETLHAALTLPTGSTQTFTVQANAVGGGSTITQDQSGSASVSGGFSSSTAGLAATTPTAIPTSGKYMWDFGLGPRAFGRKLVRAVVVDFAAY